MVSAGSDWWRRHGWTVVLLLSAFGIALLIRTVFMAPVIELFGPLNVYGGGSDSFYHSRVMTYIIQTHTNLVRDPGLHYPFGAVNPREPLFDWMNAILGILSAPLFGGNAVVAGAWWLDFQGPLWAALGVFPVYLIGREVSSRRMGLVAALLYPFLVANIDSSTFGYANYLSFYTFFILLTLYGFLRTIKATGTRRWVESYRRPGQFPGALRAFLRTERQSVKWAVFTGVSFGALALAWQGYSYAVAAIVVFLVVQLIIERIRRVDSLGLYVNTWIIGLIGFPMAIPYYLPQGLFAGWFDLPLLIYFGALLILLPFVFLRDSPWVVSVPVLVGITAAAVGALDVLNHAFFVNIVTGQGYFVKTLIYSTVAEAQAPSIDALILGFGVVTFFLAFVGLAFVVWRLARERFKRQHLLFLVFGILSIYLPVSAAKFFFLGSAAFALLPAEVVVRLLDVANFGTYRRTVASLSDRRSQFSALRRGFKARYVLVILLLVVLLLPNVWYSVDAGIPYNSKSQFSQQIYNSLPAPLRVSPQNATSFYLGAAGTQLDTPSQYDESGYLWLAGQDQGVPLQNRPAFISWWDYGFQALAQGLHPTVADNFQNGIDPAGNFLLAQNETLSIGILATTLLQAEQTASHDPYLPPALNHLLSSDGVNLTTLHTLMVNTSQDVPLVLAHPDRYLPVDPANIDPTNAMFDTVSWFLATSLSESALVQVYGDIQTFTHWSIRYAMVDSRLFPFSGSNTGIFYAPADLTDRVIGAGGAPTAYYTLSVLGSDGNTYAVGAVPAGVSAVQYNINYLPAFYNSTIYRTFIGYTGTEAGQSAGIPGLSSGLTSLDPMPGWMMQHFRVVYRTAYYCPYSNPTGHSGCFQPMNLIQAQALQKQQNGTLDASSSAYFQGGESILEYYPGQPMTGVVSLPGGTPVPAARVTVFDEWGIPHQTVLTSADGAYSVILPPGNDTINVTVGPVYGLLQQGQTSLATIHLYVSPVYGLSPTAPTLVRPIVLNPGTVEGFVYWNTANNSSYIPNADLLVPGASAILWGNGHPTRTALTDASGAFVIGNVAPGVYNLSIAYDGANFSQPQVYVRNGQSVNASHGLSPATLEGVVRTDTGVPAVGATVQVQSESGEVSATTTNATGGFRIPNLGPGNYSATASLPGEAMASPPAAVSFAQPGGLVRTNFTLAPVVQISFAVVANGAPVAAFPVRLSPTPVLAQPVTATPSPNGTHGSPAPNPNPVGAAQTNSSVFYSDANGFVRAVVPAGNYTVYGLGLIGGTFYSGFETSYAAATSAGVTLDPLTLAPANSVSGKVQGISSSGGLSSPTEVLAYDVNGNVVTGFTNASGGYRLELPAGTYSLFAVEGLTVASSPVAIGSANVTVSGPTVRDLALESGSVVTAQVGVPVYRGATAISPTADATVRVTFAPAGATLFVHANATGFVRFVVPTLAAPGESFCLSVSAYGYAPFSRCGLSPTSVSGIGTIPLSPNPVAVALSVNGLPAGAAITVNLTAASPTARTTNVTGGPSFALSLTPGDYTLSAFSTASGGGLYLPPNVLNVTLPVGARTTNLTLTVVREVAANGTLRLPGALPATAVTVRFLSPTVNVTVSGSAFEGRFLIAPGTYTVYAAAPGANESFASLSSVTVNATGVLSSAIDLTAPAPRVTVNLTRPDGALLTNTTVPIAITGPGGLTFTVEALGGQALVALPANATYALSATATVLEATAGGAAAYVTYSSVAGTACAVGPSTRFCTVPLVAATVPTPVTGRLVVPGFPGALAGTVTISGPGVGGPVTSVAVTNGTFSVGLLPGSYLVYATAGGPSAPVANVTRLTVGATAGPPITLLLRPTWLASVTLTAPPGGTLGAATVTFQAADGTNLTFPGEPFGSPLTFVLPEGVYALRAIAPTAPYGIATNATANTTVSLLSGNAAIALSLANRLVRTAVLTTVAPTNVVLGDGGVATFTFTVRNTGNAPEALHFVGSPSTWTFDFAPENLTLGVGGANLSASVEVTVRVPVGTPVAHPSIQLEAELADGTPVGFAQPLPQVTLTPVYGLGAGLAASGGASVAPFTVTQSVYLVNTGTAPESVRLGIGDAARLAGIGWSATVVQGRTTITAPVSLAVAANVTYLVRLTAPTGHALAPGSATLVATVLNGSGAVGATLTVPIPTLAVSLNASGVVVTGPSLGSPPAYPDWLVPLLSFVPAIALAAAIIGYRWYRTRRWTRR